MYSYKPGHNTQDCPGPPKLGQGKGGLFPSVLGAWSHQHPISRTAGEYISIVRSHLGCGNLSGQPQENTSPFWKSCLSRVPAQMSESRGSKGEGLKCCWMRAPPPPPQPQGRGSTAGSTPFKNTCCIRRRHGDQKPGCLEAIHKPESS